MFLTYPSYTILQMFESTELFEACKSVCFIPLKSSTELHQRHYIILTVIIQSPLSYSITIISLCNEEATYQRRHFSNHTYHVTLNSILIPTLKNTTTN